MTHNLIKINGINGNLNEELLNAKKVLLKAQIKQLQTGAEKRPTREWVEQELHTKIHQLQQMDLIPILHEMIEDNCTVKELNDKVKEMGFARIDITIIKPKKEQ